MAVSLINQTGKTVTFGNTELLAVPPDANNFNAIQATVQNVNNNNAPALRFEGRNYIHHDQVFVDGGIYVIRNTPGYIKFISDTTRNRNDATVTYRQGAIEQQ